MSRRIVHPTQIISQDDLGTRIVGITTIAEKLGDVLNVLLAPIEFVLGAGVINADQEGLLAH